jgi:hypothetical protein
MKQVNHTFFMMVRTTDIWLALTPKDRYKYFYEVIFPILKKYPKVSMRFFDSEAFNSDFSDLLMWETSDIMSYQSIVEELRETKFWGPYFSIRQIVPSIENAFDHHYKTETKIQGDQ